MSESSVGFYQKTFFVSVACDYEEQLSELMTRMTPHSRSPWITRPSTFRPKTRRSERNGFELLVNIYISSTFVSSLLSISPVSLSEDTIVRHNTMSRRSVARTGGAPVKMEDFDRKLTETDCYLQMLIDQNSELEAQVVTEGGEVYQPLVEKVK